LKWLLILAGGDIAPTFYDDIEIAEVSFHLTIQSNNRITDQPINRKTEQPVNRF